MSHDTQFELDGELLEDFSNEDEEWGGGGSEEEDDDDLDFDGKSLSGDEEEEETE